jgi:hypothetical protein
MPGSFYKERLFWLIIPESLFFSVEYWSDGNFSGSLEMTLKIL